jgi:acetyl esterase/lipase
MMNPFEPGFITTMTRPLALDKVTRYIGWDAQSMIDGVNFVIDQVNGGRLQYRPLYTAADIAGDGSRADAGMLFIPGRPGARLAFVMAGGGWRAQANLQESFPLAAQLHRLGYHVVVVRYRVGVHKDDPRIDDDPTEGRQAAVRRSQEDFAAAVRDVAQHAEEWAVSLAGYSVWGSSAGAQVAMQWGIDGPLGAQAQNAPRPAAIIAAYPPDYFWRQSAQYPPLYVVAAANDDLVPVQGTDRIVASLRAQGSTVEYRRLGSGGHGFGLGVGTEAAGWVDAAEAFWRRVA